jgi:hypothetical protein
MPTVLTHRAGLPFRGSLAFLLENTFWIEFKYLKLLYFFDIVEKYEIGD